MKSEPKKHMVNGYATTLMKLLYSNKGNLGNKNVKKLELKRNGSNLMFYIIDQQESCILLSCISSPSFTREIENFKIDYNVMCCF